MYHIPKKDAREILNHTSKFATTHLAVQEYSSLEKHP
jgi:hypothetical protein